MVCAVIGKHLLRALSAKGIEIRAFIHSKKNEEAVLAEGATEVFVGDLTSREDSANAMKGVDKEQRHYAAVLC